MVEMVDVSQKPPMIRIATAKGEILLQKDTIVMIRNGQIKKGDPLTVAGIAAMTAVKKTPELIPFCHQVLITDVKTNFTLKDDRVEAQVTAKSIGQTGVEIEALVGVSMALTTIWDMVKYVEKDAQGQYPNTAIVQIQVMQKIKSALEEE